MYLLSEIEILKIPGEEKLMLQDTQYLGFVFSVFFD